MVRICMHIVKYNIKKWKQNYNILLGLIYLLIISDMMFRPARKIVEQLGFSPNISSFSLIWNSTFFILLFFLGVILFYSDAPFQDSMTSFVMIRCGKIKFMIAQICYIFLLGILIPGVFFLIQYIFLLPTEADGWGKFWGTISGGVKGVTGMYQAGFFPVMMFGLPGAALAMYRCARKENKKKVGAILFSAALASFFTGVTEPLEFAFMFVAPTLYFIHALLTGLMLFIAATFKWMAGFGFSAGLIDYVLSFKSPFANNVLFLIPLGILCGLIYYIVFRVLITRYNIMTPGREENEVKKVEKVENNFDEIAIQLFEALGGKKNIISVDHCITRLRVEVKDISLIDKQTLSKMNFSHIVESSEHEIQIIIGTEVQFIAEILNEILM